MANFRGKTCPINQRCWRPWSTELIIFKLWPKLFLLFWDLAIKTLIWQATIFFNGNKMTYMLLNGYYICKFWPIYNSNTNSGLFTIAIQILASHIGYIWLWVNWSLAKEQTLSLFSFRTTNKLNQLYEMQKVPKKIAPKKWAYLMKHHTCLVSEI